MNNNNKFLSALFTQLLSPTSVTSNEIVLTFKIEDDTTLRFVLGMGN